MSEKMEKKNNCWNNDVFFLLLSLDYDKAIKRTWAYKVSNKDDGKLGYISLYIHVQNKQNPCHLFLSNTANGIFFDGLKKVSCRLNIFRTETNRKQKIYTK